jgi:hypothetical protein
MASNTRTVPRYCEFQHSKVAPSSHSTLTGAPCRVWIKAFDIRSGGLDASTGSTCRDDCWRKRSGTSIAGSYERRAGGGHRGSHQSGKTPIGRSRCVRVRRSRNSRCAYRPSDAMTRACTASGISWSRPCSKAAALRHPDRSRPCTYRREASWRAARRHRLARSGSRRCRDRRCARK